MNAWAYSLVSDIPTQALIVALDKDLSEFSFISTFITMSTMNDIDKEEQRRIIAAITASVNEVKIRASGTNSTVDGVSVSSDIIQLHELIKAHKLVFTDLTSPPGRWSWNGLLKIKNKNNDTTNPNLKMPDGVSTFYGSLKYDYNLSGSSGGIKVVTHDVVAISPIFLDAKSWAPSRNVNAGTYGVDWWNVYMPINLLEKLSLDIKQATGYVTNQEGLMDDVQQLASVTINVHDVKDSPKITMICEEPITRTDDDTSDPGTELTYTDMGTLAHLMNTGGEEHLIGGMGVLTIGVSCKHHSGQDPSAAGSFVKMSLKMKAFHAVSIVESGISRISFTPVSKSLVY
jgi:hypothetical protein